MYLSFDLRVNQIYLSKNQNLKCVLFLAEKQLYTAPDVNKI